MEIVKHIIRQLIQPELVGIPDSLLVGLFEA